jgi:PKD repeat protein
VGASYTAGLDPVIAGQLQGAAALVVLDSLTNWNLRSTEDLTVANFTSSNSGNTVQFTNISDHATSYLWDFGDGTNSTENDPSHDYLTNGQFTVQLVAVSECGNDTVTQQVQISYWGLEEVKTSFKVRTLDDGIFVIENPEGIINKMDLTDAQGKVILRDATSDTNQMVLNLSGFAPGIYFVRSNSASFKLIYQGR